MRGGVVKSEPGPQEWAQPRVVQMNEGGGQVVRRGEGWVADWYWLNLMK